LAGVMSPSGPNSSSHAPQRVAAGRIMTISLGDTRFKVARMRSSRRSGSTWAGLRFETFRSNAARCARAASSVAFAVRISRLRRNDALRPRSPSTRWYAKYAVSAMPRIGPTTTRARRPNLRNRIMPRKGSFPQAARQAPPIRYPRARIKALDQGGAVAATQSCRHRLPRAQVAPLCGSVGCIWRAGPSATAIPP
jgi:hypothetical protein